MLFRACIFTWKSIILFVLHTINEFGFTAFYRFSLQKKKPNALRHSMNCSHQYTKHGGLFTAMEIKRHLNNSLNRHISFVDSDGAFHFEFLTRIYYFNRKHFVAWSASSISFRTNIALARCIQMASKAQKPFSFNRH